MRETLKETGFAKLLAEIVEDAGTLFRQELQLAKAEVSRAVDDKVRALIYAIVAALFGLIAVLLFSVALALGLIRYGIAPHWAFSVVALAALAVAAITISVAKSKFTRSRLAHRSINQIKQNVAAAKEVLP